MTKGDRKLLIRYMRRASLVSEMRNECLRRARKRVREGNFKNGKPKFKLYWQCAECRSWHPKSNQLEVDHIIEIGEFTGDWNEYVNRMFCDQSNLRAVCVVCHARKTAGANSQRLYQRKNRVLKIV